MELAVAFCRECWVGCPHRDGTERQEHMDAWLAGFIEDAVTLHLTTKRIISKIISTS